MAQDNYIGVAMGLDVSDLKSGLAETKKAISMANKEFANASAGMDDWKKSGEGVAAKLNQLEKILSNQEKAVAGYRAELDHVSEEYGENSVQAQTYRAKLLDAETAVKKTEKQIRNFSSSLEDIQQEEASTITDTDRLENTISELGSTLSKQKKRVSDYESALEKAKAEHGETSQEVKDLTKKLNDAKGAVDKTEKAQKAYTSQLGRVQSESGQTTTSTKKMSSAMRDADNATVDLKGGFTVLKGAMANLVSSGIQAVISGLQNAVTESREFRSEMSFLQATADKTGASFDQAKDKVKEVYSVLGEQDSAVEGLNNLMTAGFDGDALDKITDQLIGASIQWHDTLKFEGLADGLQETLATGKAVGPFVELLERGGLVAEDFDEGLAKCTTDAEKQNYVLKTLSKLGLAEVTEGYKDSNKELVEGAEAQFEYEEAMAGVGAKVEPVMTTIKQGWADVLTAVLDTSDGVSTSNLQGAIKDAFTWFIDTCVPAIKKAVKFVMDNKDEILALIAGIGAGYAAWKAVTIIQGIITATKTWWATTEGLTLAQKLLNTVMSMNPIGLVIAAIAALVAIFVVLWNKCDWFREFWINLWEDIKKYAKIAWEAICGFFSKAWEWIQQAWSGVVEWFQNLWSSIKNVWSEVTGWFGNLFTESRKKVEDAWSSVVDWFSNLWSGIKNVFSTVVNFYVTTYSNAWKGIQKAWSTVVKWFKDLWSKIKNAFSSVGTFFRDKFQTAWNNIKNAWSNVVSWFKNIWTSITNVFSAVGSWFKEKFQTAWNNVKNAWSKAGSWFGSIWKSISNAFSSANTWFKSKFQTAWNNVKSAWSSAGSWFAGIWSKIKSAFSSVASTLGGFFRTAWSNIKSAFSGVSSWASGIVNKIVGFFKELPDKLLNIGKDMMDGLKEGITSGLKKVKNAASDAVSGVVGKFKGLLGINSPSKVMRDEVGKMMGAGVGEGILASTKGVLKDAQRFTDGITKGMSQRISDINLGLNASAGSLNPVQSAGGSVTNVTNNFNQTINAPKAPSRIELYRQSKNLLSMKG